MQIQTLPGALAGNPYPGRGILLGLADGGSHAVLAYFIMGRSQNSRNRVFVQTEDRVLTRAANPAKVEDPSLILYNAVRKLGKRTIVTNGDQTDTIYDCLAAGLSFEHALRARTFEPDAPNYTPRISGLLTRDVDGFFYQLSILKSAGGNPASPQRFFYEYPQPIPGQGHLIHTYKQDGNPLPSFVGEPVTVALSGEIDTLAGSLWQALNPDNKISLLVRCIDKNGGEETRIFNRYKAMVEEQA